VLIHRAGVHQAATGIAIRHDHDSLRIQYFGGLRHEPDAAEGNHFAIELLRLAGEFQAVADDVGQLLNF
jgi:hypothetical protein